MDVKQGKSSGTPSRGLASREAILRAAVSVVGRQGLPAASLGVIAREAGTSKPAVLYHFGSREKLLHEMASRALDDLVKRAAGGAAEAERPQEQVSGAIDAVFSKENRLLMASVRELITLGIRDPVVGEAVNQAYTQLAQMAAPALSALPDQPHAADDLVHALTGFVQRWLCSGEEDPGPYRAGALRIYARMTRPAG